MSDSIYLSTQDDGIYCSSDNGNSWAACNEGLPYLKSPSIAKTADNTLFAIVQTNNYSKAYLYKSTDFGDHWIQSSDYEINGYVTKLFISSTDILFCNENESILYSSDNGANWIHRDVGSEIYNFAETSTGVLIASGSYGIFISEDNGMSWNYKQITNTIVGVNINKNRNYNYFLSANYPNPFNPTTNIKYRIPYREFVALKIYDVLGNEIETLVNEEKPAGSYSVNFNASSLASGIYFYRIKAGSFVQTKKMLLLK